MECQSSSSKVAQQTSRKIFKEKISWLDRIANYNDTFKWYKSKTMQNLTKKKKKKKRKQKKKENQKFMKVTWNVNRCIVSRFILQKYRRSQPVLLFNLSLPMTFWKITSGWAYAGRGRRLYQVKAPPPMLYGQC